MSDTSTAISPDPASSQRRWPHPVEWLVQALIVTGCLYVYLQGWHRDFSVPFRFSVDALVAELQSKSTVDHGWWWFNPSVGAPFGLDALQFPLNSNVDQAFVWLVSRVVGPAMSAVNAAWCGLVVLSGCTAQACARRLGISRPSAFVVGTLFALTPFALIRNIGHFWMVIYLVPFACTAAIEVADARVSRWWWGRGGVAVLVGCALLGVNYVYDAFFATWLICVGIGVAWIQHRSRTAVMAGVCCLVVVTTATAINLAPTFRSWAREGHPLITREKTPAEAEIYGLKIRQLVSPALWHTFPPFRAWLEREEAAAFPNETENRSTRLGVVATAGFLVLMAGLFAPRLFGSGRHATSLLAASRLNLSALLLATVGGFGSLVSLLVSSDIRAYNRISPFIAFLSLLAVGFILDRLPRRGLLVPAAVGIAVIGLLDQRAAAWHVNSIHADTAGEWRRLQDTVHGLESRLPAGALVFQLPFRTYLNDDGVGRMQPYDLIKPYLASRTLRWSYPALTNRSAHWQRAAALLPSDRLVRELALEGFSAILIDRYGYEDSGDALLAEIDSVVGHDARLTTSERYVGVDLRGVTPALRTDSILARAHDFTPATATVPACGGAPLMYLDSVGARVPPYGNPLPLGRHGDVRVSGWAVDQQAGTVGLGFDLVVDGRVLPAIYGLDRPDVASHYGQRRYVSSGFIGAIPVDQLGVGTHTLSFRVLRADGTCYLQAPELAVSRD